MADCTKSIGVLDLHGGVHEHLDHLSRAGVCCEAVKYAEQIARVAGLILPGGESTCLARLLRVFGLWDAILDAHRAGMKLWGTCAGAILLARDNVGDAPHLGLIDIAVQRNAFGSQLDSFHTAAVIPEVSSEPVPLTFIRAPKIVRAGKDVRILLRMDDYIAAAETDDILVSIFHPELTPCLAFHRYFARKCGIEVGDGQSALSLASDWDRRSWMHRARIA